ncbi:MAG: GH36 C-terminal domain-containing protein [Verrucomicrobiota bacterium]
MEFESDAWIGWQFDRREVGKGVVQAFRRPQSAYETARFKLRGLEPQSTYTLTNLDLPGTIEMSGNELSENGLPVAITNQPGAAVILYWRAAH